MDKTIEITPCISISSFKSKKKKSPKILPPNEVFTLTITYPLDNPFITEINSGKKGLTQNELINIICKNYRQIYKEEKDITGEIGEFPGTYNRAATHGKYGISRHVIEDLVLERIYKS